MQGMTPRIVRLLAASVEGADFRHCVLQIAQPLAVDAEVQPGQFFMLAVPGQGEAAFTYLSRPDADGRFEALIRRVGSLTAAVFASEPGAVFGYRGPCGQGWPLLYGHCDVLLVAGGCGLAPLASLIGETLASRPEVQLRLLYASRDAAHQILTAQRQAWSTRMPVHCSLDAAGEHPRTHLRRLCRERRPDTLLCCGPEAFMLAMAETGVEEGVPAEQIWLSAERRMHCGVGLCGHCHVGDTLACTDGPSYRYDRYRALLQGNGCLL